MRGKGPVRPEPVEGPPATTPFPLRPHPRYLGRMDARHKNSTAGLEKDRKALLPPERTSRALPLQDDGDPATAPVPITNGGFVPHIFNSNPPTFALSRTKGAGRTWFDRLTTNGEAALRPEEEAAPPFTLKRKRPFALSLSKGRRSPFDAAQNEQMRPPLSLEGRGQDLVSLRPEPQERRAGRAGPWFDRLTTNGEAALRPEEEAAVHPEEEQAVRPELVEGPPLTLRRCSG